METIGHPGISELHEIYTDLAPLERSREVYLLATVFREELGLSMSWSYELDQAQREYGRRIGESLNASVQDLTDSEEIENMLVHQLVTETQRRWVAYTECIEGKDKEQEFIELLPNEPSITCSLEEKTKQVRTSWRKFIEDYGVANAEFSPVVRSEFISNKTMWDTTKESRFLQTVLMDEQPEERAA